MGGVGDFTVRESPSSDFLIVCLQLLKSTNINFPIISIIKRNYVVKYEKSHERVVTRVTIKS